MWTPRTEAGDWPNFRGPNHDGVSDETGFRTAWTEPIPLVWEREVGSAFSSFAVVGDRVITCGTHDKQQVLVCLNATNGELIWRTPIEKEYSESHGDGTRSTPTVDDGRVYILGGHGTLLCVDAASGRQLWKKEFNDTPTWGYAGSVLIEGELAIATAGGSQGSLAAFDKRTGREVWKCGDDPPGYATPYPFTFAGQRYIVGFTGTSIIVAEAETGRLAWRTEWETDHKVNASSPIYHDGHLFVSSGYSTGAGLFKLRKTGDELTGDIVWKDNVLLTKFQSCVLYKGNLYTSDQKALVCVEFLTGQERWRIPRVQNGPLTLADGHLLLMTEEGQLQIAEAGPDGFEPKTKADLLSGRCWSVPVLSNGRIYARSLERLVCFDLRGARETTD